MLLQTYDENVSFPLLKNKYKIRTMPWLTFLFCSYRILFSCLQFLLSKGYDLCVTWIPRPKVVFLFIFLEFIGNHVPPYKFILLITFYRSSWANAVFSAFNVILNCKFQTVIIFMIGNTRLESVNPELFMGLGLVLFS